MHLLLRFATAALVALIVVSPAVPNAHAVTIDLVRVGDGGNASDITGYGAVADPFWIGKYCVTIQQYTDFLNAVAATDTYALWNSVMFYDANIAGIARSGSSGSYTYSVMGSSGNMPISYTTWLNAARFANWMQNGQGAGSTETGAYTLNGMMSGTAPARNPGAQIYIPTEDQWYKAAYYSPLLNSGSGGYYTYATQSNTAPGNVVGSDANQANYNNGVYSVTQNSNFDMNQNYLTDVGAFTNSASYYGTFDQSGNVFQWNDLDGTADTFRGVRGGIYSLDASYMQSSFRDTGFPSSEAGGFRLASPVPEPATLGMASGGALCACGGWMLKRRRKRA